MTDPLIEILTPKTDWYVVLRSFDSGSDNRPERGEVVDGSQWTHTRKLVEARYIAHLPHGVDLPKENKEGRRFLNLDKKQESALPKSKAVSDKAKEEKPAPKKKPASEKKPAESKAS